MLQRARAVSAVEARVLEAQRACVHVLNDQATLVPRAGRVLARRGQHRPRRVVVPALGVEVAVDCEHAPGVIRRPERRLLDAGGDAEQLGVGMHSPEVHERPCGLYDLPDLAVLAAGREGRYAPCAREDGARVAAKGRLLEVIELTKFVVDGMSRLALPTWAR